MSIRSDFILWQIEKACALIASLMSKKKLEQKEEAEVNQTLSDLTGLNVDMFADPAKAPILPIMLNALEDNQKALVAKLLQIKNPDIYGALAEKLLGQINWSKVHSQVKKFEV